MNQAVNNQPTQEEIEAPVTPRDQIFPLHDPLTLVPFAPILARHVAPIRTMPPYPLRQE